MSEQSLVTLASVTGAPCTITVEVRHGRECSHRDPAYKKCNCRKQLYIYENGKDRIESAKTRSWEEAERYARQKKGDYDPHQIAARKLDEARAQVLAEVERKRMEAEARRITIPAALAEWRDGCKIKSDSLERHRNTITDKLIDWAKEKKLTYLDEVTPVLLRGWVNKWSPNADNPRDRLKHSSQTTYFYHIKGFFSWAVEACRLDRNPASIIRCENESDDETQTQPLSSNEQFRLILDATYQYDQDRQHGAPLYGRDLRAIFLLQRCTGIRIGDATSLRRTAIKRNPQGIYVMTLKTQKTGALIKDRPLPMAVVEALQAIPEHQKHVREGYYFWSAGCQLKYHVNQWRKRITDLNQYFSLVDENGEPMPFRSHMLRDTFAVELLMAEPPVPIEEVSKLLTHKSIKMTEKYYAPWIAKRLEKMHLNMIRAMEGMGMSFTPAAAPPVDQATTPLRIM